MLKHEIKNWFKGKIKIEEWPSTLNSSGLTRPCFNDWLWKLESGEWFLTNGKNEIHEHDVFPLPKIYIAGASTGYNNFNRDRFHEKAAELISLGHTVLNPAILPDGLTESQYMDVSLAMLRCADVIHMLPGYAQSPGARVELALAKKTGIKVTYE